MKPRKPAITQFATVALFGTAWLAIACWAAAQWLRAPSASLAWTLGCAANLAHVVLAFHFVHHWDHALAYAAVAKQTYEQTGIDSGFGLDINYAFTALWLVDTTIWWVFPARYARRSRGLDASLQFIFLFMFFNATVVFGKSSLRMLGWILCPLGVVGWFRSHARTGP